MNIKKYVDIKDYSTLKIGGKFRYFTVINSTAELPSICAIAQVDGKYQNIPLFILGGGSNIVFSDGVLNVIALKIEINGFEIVNETDDYIDIKVGAGEIWDKIVEKTVEMNLSGLESLAAIPGTVGACPVQNIGAYGSEVKDTIQSVEVFDIKNGIITTLSNSDCKFGYRDSIFKNEAKGKYIITAVTFRLNKQNEKQSLFFGSHSSLKTVDENNIAHATKSDVSSSVSRALSYLEVIQYFESRRIENPSLKNIRNAIIEIRAEKLPNPKDIPNVGSFFKNPIVSNDIANKIIIEFPNAKFYPTGNGLTKVPAGWLIEQAGLKGHSFGKVTVYEKNALVLVNQSGATCGDIINARNKIIKIVFDKFGISLEQEPEII